MVSGQSTLDALNISEAGQVGALHDPSCQLTLNSLRRCITSLIHDNTAADHTSAHVFCSYSTVVLLTSDAVCVYIHATKRSDDTAADPSCKPS